jgi:hypothetical protein
MIHLRPRGPTPASLGTPTVTAIKNLIAGKIGRGERVKSKEYVSHWLKEDVRRPLWTRHGGKCGFCERQRDITRESDIEHFRPKAGISGEASHPGYWWLAYEWTNYLYACKTCNQEWKKNQFPLLPSGIRARAPQDSLPAERAALLDPFEDYPEKCLCYTWQFSNNRLVMVLGTDAAGRGDVTASVVGLNRVPLMEERAELLNSLQTQAWTMIAARRFNDPQTVKEMAKIIRFETDKKRPFAGFRRFYFRGMGLNAYVATN